MQHPDFSSSRPELPEEYIQPTGVGTKMQSAVDPAKDETDVPKKHSGLMEDLL
jgi:hypothetical protein